MEKIRSYGLIHFCVVLCLVLSGCGLPPRQTGSEKKPNKEALEPPQLQQVDPSSPVPAAVSPLSWSIRVARRAGETTSDGGWEFGQVLNPAITANKSESVFLDPLQWPDETGSELVLQLKGIESGEWSFRCVLADQTIEQASSTFSLDWDPATRSAVVPLSMVFGRRGSSRDPSTICHVDLRYEGNQGREWATFSVRVMSGLPEPLPIQEEVYPMSAGGVFRREVWKNQGFRNLRLHLQASSSVRMLTKIDSGEYFLLGDRRYLQSPLNFFSSIASGVQIQARIVFGSRDWSAWENLPISLDWPSGSALQVEYRLGPLPGAPICKVGVTLLWTTHLNRNLWRAHISEATSRYFTGKIQFQPRVEDASGLRKDGSSRQVEGVRVQQLEDVFPVLNTTAFDCQGWVP